MARSPTTAQLRNFNAHAIVDQEIKYTLVGGRFSPARPIDLSSQTVVLSFGGEQDFQLSLSAGSFSKTVLGGYVGRATSSFSEIVILLQPFSGGDWAYSAGIDGFIPAATPLTIRLTIGNQSGTAATKVFVI